MREHNGRQNYNMERLEDKQGNSFVSCFGQRTEINDMKLELNSIYSLLEIQPRNESDYFSREFLLVKIFY